MSKKVKPSSLLDEPQVTDVVESSTTVIDEKNPLVGDNRMTFEQKEKLERYDALEKSVKGLVKEKEDLTVKVAEYAERLAELQIAADQLSDLNKQIDDLKKQLVNEKANVESAFKLKTENKDLREEVNTYLVKISELTFENANLKCQLDELSKNISKSGNMPNSSAFAPQVTNTPQTQGRLAQPRRDAYNPYYNNGYGTW